MGTFRYDYPHPHFIALLQAVHFTKLYHNMDGDLQISGMQTLLNAM